MTPRLSVILSTMPSIDICQVWAIKSTLPPADQCLDCNHTFVQAQRLQDVAASLESRALREVPWSATVWCTQNFVQTVAAQAVGHYLRPVDSLLLFHDGSTLLVSEREAHCLLEVLWELPEADRGASQPAQPRDPELRPAKLQRRTEREADAPQGAALAAASAESEPPLAPVLMNLVYARRQLKLQQGAATLATCGPSAFSALSAPQIATLKLIAGETQFTKDACFHELTMLAKGRLAAAELITRLRDTQRLLPCSDLEMTALVQFPFL